MKKVFSLFAIAAVGCLLMTSCKDDDYVEKINTVQITAADTEIPVAGGSKTISATGVGLTATAADEWLTVSTSGNTVTVTAPENESLQTRHTTVTIKASNGDEATVNVSQAGFVFAIDSESAYIFDESDNESAEFLNMSNVDVSAEVSDSWIHLTQTTDGYKIDVDDNAGEYRRGSVTFSVKDLTKTVYVGQWGEVEPTLGGNYYALYQAYDDDDELSWYYRPVTVTEGTAANTYTIEGLCPAASKPAVPLNYNASTGDYYITSGYSPGTWSSYTLRFVMNYQNTSTGNEYVATTINTSATNAYRMSFAFDTDEEAYLVFKYVKNSNLSATYVTPGFQIQAYTSATSAAATYRAGYLYMYWNLQLYRVEDLM